MSEDRLSIAQTEEAPIAQTEEAPIAETEEAPIDQNEEVPITEQQRSSLSIVPKRHGFCDDLKEETGKIIKLTDENASEYAGMSSHVGWKGRVDYALDHLEKDSDLDSDFLSGLLESVISTVILLASGGTPPDNYLISTHMYLGYIRNEFGEHPPNIAAFLEYLKTISSKEVLSVLNSNNDPDVDELPQNLVITQIPKALQQRLCK